MWTSRCGEVCGVPRSALQGLEMYMYEHSFCLGSDLFYVISTLYGPIVAIRPYKLRICISYNMILHRSKFISVA